MPCTPFSLPGGIRGIVCSRTRRPKHLCGCGRPATLQCDAPSPRRSGTCDRHLCARCATEIGPDQHLCQAHADQGAAPAQAVLDFG